MDAPVAAASIPANNGWFVHDRVRQENFVEPAPAKIQRRRVIEGARSAYSRKPHVIGPIPETVSRLRRACLRSGSLKSELLFGIGPCPGFLWPPVAALGL